LVFFAAPTCDYPHLADKPKLDLSHPSSRIFLTMYFNFITTAAVLSIATTLCAASPLPPPKFQPMSREQLLYYAKMDPPKFTLPFTLKEDSDKILELHDKWKKGQLYGTPDGHPIAIRGLPPLGKALQIKEDLKDSPPV